MFWFRYVHVIFEAYVSYYIKVCGLFVSFSPFQISGIWRRHCLLIYIQFDFWCDIVIPDGILIAVLRTINLLGDFWSDSVYHQRVKIHTHTEKEMKSTIFVLLKLNVQKSNSIFIYTFRNFILYCKYILYAIVFLYDFLLVDCYTLLWNYLLFVFSFPFRFYFIGQYK